MIQNRFVTEKRLENYLQTSELQNAIDGALEQAKESGEFDYVLTDGDKQEIAELAAEFVEIPEGGNTNLPGHVNVKDYGAAGDDETDDTEAIASAIADVKAGDTLYFPEGVYRVSNINLKSDMTVKGDGWCSVIKLLDATTDYRGYNNCLSIKNVSNVIVKDIKLDGARETQRSEAAAQDQRLNGLFITSAQNVYIENVWMYNNGYHGCMMVHVENITVSHCRSSFNGFRPIHGHTEVYNCRVSNCICEDNGKGLTGGSGFENDAVFFFGVQRLVINDNIVRSNRRGCICVGVDADSITTGNVILSSDISITGNVCECYEDLPYVPSTDTEVAKFSSQGIVVYGGGGQIRNVTVSGNTIKNAHEAIYLYSWNNTITVLNAAITGNAVIDCSIGIKAIEVTDVTITGNQFRNLANTWIYADKIENFNIHGNNVNAFGISSDHVCHMQNSNNIVIRDNNISGDSLTAIYAPGSNNGIVIADNTLYGFTTFNPIQNINGATFGNVVDATMEEYEKIRLDPYTGTNYAHGSNGPIDNSEGWRSTVPVKITDNDVLYRMNTYISTPKDTTPEEYDGGSNMGIIFLERPEISTLVGYETVAENNGTVTFSGKCIEGETTNTWGAVISITAEQVKELYPTAKYVMMQVLKHEADAALDNSATLRKALSDGHSYVYRTERAAGTDDEIDLSGYVKSVNGKTPDENGNVNITISDNPVLVEKEYEAELSIGGFVRSNGTISEAATNAKRTDYIDIKDVIKIYGRVGFYDGACVIGFYREKNQSTSISTINLQGSGLTPGGSGYSHGTFELDISGEEYAEANYFVVSSYRYQTHPEYYDGEITFDNDYCKYVKLEEGTKEEGTTKPTYRISEKTIAFFGDSITSAEFGYPSLIAGITGATVENHGASGSTLASGTSATYHICEDVDAYTGSADIICVSGGINDMNKGVSLGTLTDGYSAELDTTTVIGALEYIFRSLLTKHTEAKLYYVITHKAASAELNANTSTGLTFTDYHDAIVSVLRKYSIPFYDAFSDSGFITSTYGTWGENIRNLYTVSADDGVHPNREGYLKYYAYPIISMMENEIGSGGGNYVLKSEMLTIDDVQAYIDEAILGGAW